MLTALKRLFGSTPPPAPPPPPSRRPMMVGIVWRADGTPRLDESFVNGLKTNHVLRVHVSNKLLARGFKLSDQAPFYTRA